MHIGFVNTSRGEGFDRQQTVQITSKAMKWGLKIYKQCTSNSIKSFMCYHVIKIAAQLRIVLLLIWKIHEYSIVRYKIIFPNWDELWFLRKNDAINLMKDWRHEWLIFFAFLLLIPAIIKTPAEGCKEILSHEVFNALTTATHADIRNRIESNYDKFASRYAKLHSFFLFLCIIIITKIFYQMGWNIKIKNCL